MGQTWHEIRVWAAPSGTERDFVVCLCKIKGLNGPDQDPAASLSRESGAGFRPRRGRPGPDLCRRGAQTPWPTPWTANSAARSTPSWPSRAASSSAAWASPAISRRKIAATLSSTGTPAYFVHPAEASHGDLGAITRQDVLLMLSWGGETAELSDLITYAKRFRIPLIGIASNPDSTLMQAADVKLLLPRAPRSLPDGAGADHLHHHDAGAGRCAGGGADGAQGLFAPTNIAISIPAARWAAP